jgi:hypothetical protein
MQVFLETPRLVLRRFTLADVDNLVSLNADPDVMRFITGGIPIGRVEIEDELLPAFLGYNERFDGYGKCLKRLLVMIFAASRMLAVVLTTVGLGVISS